MRKQIDVAVIGAGIAGLSAGIYLKRSSVSSLLIEKSAPGGKLLTIHDIDNYPSEIRISGPALAEKTASHAAALGVEIGYGNVLSLTKDNGFFLIVTDSEQIEAKAVIVATGTLIRTLGVAGEKEFLGRGVSYCATCDGNFFKGKDVAVSGAKDQAVEEAIYLAGLVHHLYFLAPSDIDAPETHLKTLMAIKNVEIIEKASLKAIKGERTVSSIEAMVEGKEKEYLVSGVFPLSGERSSSDFLAGLKPDNRNGFLTVDLNMKTSIPGLFAAGDVVDRSLRQIVTASSDGAVAATSAIAYVHALTK